MLKIKNGRAYTQRLTKDGHMVWQVSKIDGLAGHKKKAAIRKAFKATICELLPLQDGRYRLSGGSVKPGDQINLEGKPAPDNTYILEDEGTIKTLAGIVIEYTPGQQQ
jgi:hypothetical protein